ASLVQGPAPVAAFLGGQAPESLVQRRQGRPGAEQVELRRLQLIQGRGRVDAGATVVDQRDEVVGHAPTSSASRGSVKPNVLPIPASEWATRRPPWASTRPRLIHRPRPEPVGRVSARRKNLVKTRGRSDSGMPSPRSTTVT